MLCDKTIVLCLNALSHTTPLARSWHYTCSQTYFTHPQTPGQTHLVHLTSIPIGSPSWAFSPSPSFQALWRASWYFLAFPGNTNLPFCPSTGRWSQVEAVDAIRRSVGDQRRLAVATGEALGGLGSGEGLEVC